MKVFNNILELIQNFSDENKCREYLAQLRWENEVICPFCGYHKVYNIESGKRYKCANKECYKKFSVTVGTIFENTKIPLKVWFVAIYLACNHKKGISSFQLSKDLGITQKTAWFVLHRIREMLKEKAPQVLSKEVEADETYIGGLEKNKHKNKRTKGVQGRSTRTKTAVIGIVERKGIIIAKSVANTKSATLQPIMRHHVKIGSKIYTDEWGGYKGLSKDYNHSIINHSNGEYVVGNIHTNTIDGFWSLFKRGIIGIYHYVSPKHLDRYCVEFTYRYNTIDNSLNGRFDIAIKQSVDRRLKYNDLINKFGK